MKSKISLCSSLQRTDYPFTQQPKVYRDIMKKFFANSFVHSLSHFWIKHIMWVSAKIKQNEKNCEWAAKLFMFPFVSWVRIFFASSLCFCAEKRFTKIGFEWKKRRRNFFFVFVLACTKGSATMKHFRFLLAPSSRCKMREFSDSRTLPKLTLNFHHPQPNFLSFPTRSTKA